MVLDRVISQPRLHVLLVDPDSAAAARLRHAIGSVEDDAWSRRSDVCSGALPRWRRPASRAWSPSSSCPICPGSTSCGRCAPRGRSFPVIVVTDAGSEDLAVAAMKLGAVDYIRKHAATAPALLAAVRAAAGRAVLSGLDDESGAGTSARPPLPDPDFVATTGRMRQVLVLVERAARAGCPCSSRARPAPARSCWRERSMPTARGRRRRS